MKTFRVGDRVTVPPSLPWRPDRALGTVADVRRHSQTGETICVFVEVDHLQQSGREPFRCPYRVGDLERVKEGETP